MTNEEKRITESPARMPAPDVPTSGGTPERILVPISGWLEHLIPRFLENRAKDAQVVLDAVESGAFDAIRRIAHNLKGAGGFGFMAITQIGIEMERAARAREAESVRRIARSLQDYLKRVDVEYR